jgi:methionyl-tRNA synthetase
MNETFLPFEKLDKRCSSCGTLIKSGRLCDSCEQMFKNARESAYGLAIAIKVIINRAYNFGLHE